MDWAIYNAHADRVYYSYNEYTDIQEANCHGGAFNRTKDYIVKTYYSYSRTPYSKEMIDDWFHLLNAAGFPMQKVEQDDFFEGSTYSKRTNLSFDFHIVIDRNEYENQAMYKGAITLMRMISYYIMGGYQDVIPDAVKAFKSGEDAFRSIGLGFEGKEAFPHSGHSGNYIRNHNFVHTTTGICKIRTTEELKTLSKTKSWNEIADIHK